MGVMKIGDGPRYKKTGTPLQKKQRKVAQIATLVFADLLPSVGRAMRERTTTKHPQVREGDQ
jgi:hypothetical protein